MNVGIIFEFCELKREVIMFKYFEEVVGLYEDFVLEIEGYVFNQIMMCIKDLECLLDFYI